MFHEIAISAASDMLKAYEKRPPQSGGMTPYQAFSLGVYESALQANQNWLERVEVTRPGDSTITIDGKPYDFDPPHTKPVPFWRLLLGYFGIGLGRVAPKKSRTIMIPRDRFMSISAARRSFGGFR